MAAVAGGALGVPRMFGRGEGPGTLRTTDVPPPRTTDVPPSTLTTTGSITDS